MAHVAQTSFDRGENDEEREIFKIPDIINNLIEDGRLGAKTKAGFYKKTKDRKILSLNFETMEYIASYITTYYLFSFDKVNTKFRK